LDKKGEDITGDKSLGDESDRNRGEAFSPDTPNNSRQNHIDSSSEESRRDENKDALDDIRHQTASFLIGAGPSSVADEFN
jgi:hypothetical protein